MPVYGAPPQGFKRLCILSDGTWNEPSDTYLSNIVRLSRAISFEDENQVPQIVYYDAGVGTDGSRVNRIFSGIVGKGIDENIKQLYTFLALNYHDGDEIYMFGFSRGSYTVRSLGGLIHASGLVRREHLDFVDEAYDMYRDMSITPDSEQAQAFRAEHGDRVDIKLLAVFDTVGALGLPIHIPGIGPDPNEKFRFHDTKISDRVEHAIHIVSIDEDRNSMALTPMHAHPSRGKEQVTQLYFPGYHNGVGGNHADENERLLGQNTLKFLVDEMERRGLPLAFDEGQIPQTYHDHVQPRAKPPFDIFELLFLIPGIKERKIDAISDLHFTALKRYREVLEWRPKSLEHLNDELMDAIVDS